MTTPWHLWLVAGLSVLWNGFGAADYTLTQLRMPAYVANMPEGMMAHLVAYPAWMDAVWALAVWLPLLGALLLIGRRKMAAAAFGLGLVFVIVAGVWNYLISSPALHEVAGPWVLGFWALILVLALLQWIYARTMVQRGVLG